MAAILTPTPTNEGSAMKMSSAGSDQTMESTIPAASTTSASNVSDGDQPTVDISMITNAAASHTELPMVNRSQPYFPSTESLNSSVWSSSGYSSESSSDSYDWSASLNSDSEAESDGSSDFSSSLSDDSTSSDGESLSAEAGNDCVGSPRKIKKPGLPTPPMIPIEGLPLSSEGLPLTLESLKRDLEKVGRTIISSNVGCVVAERAQTLASINWLSSHVPNAVLDHLGNEIRAMIEDEKEGVSKHEQPSDKLLTSVVDGDNMSVVSDLSDGYLNDMEFEHENAPGVKEVVEGSNVAQTGYGDLANFAHASAASFLPVNCGPLMASQRLGSASILSGIDEMNGMSSSSLFGSTELKLDEKPRESLSTLSDILASAGPADPLNNGSSHSEMSMEGGVSVERSSCRPASLPVVGIERGAHTDESRQATSHTAEKTEGARRASMGTSALKFNRDSFDQEGNLGVVNDPATRRSTNGTDVSSSLASGQFSKASSKSSKSKGVKRLFKRLVKRTSERKLVVKGGDEGPCTERKSGKKQLAQGDEGPGTERKSGKRQMAKEDDERWTESSIFVGQFAHGHAFPSRGPTSLYQGPATPQNARISNERQDVGAEVTAATQTWSPSVDDTNAAESLTETSVFSQSLQGSSATGSGGSVVTGGNDNPETRSKKRPRGENLPHASTYHCALLFVDISGFTKLSTLLDPESLSKAINAYFQLIVNEVLEGKGDLLKFAGDAVFIEWKATETISLENCVESAAACAVKITTKCSDFSVLANGNNGGSSCLVTSQAAKVSALNVHCGIGAGQMVGVHVGDHKLRREYLLLGQPIQQATLATDFARMGEVCVSHDALRLLGRVCNFDKDITVSDSARAPTVIAERGVLKFASKERMGTHQPRIVNELSRGVTSQVEGLEVDDLRKYRRMMSLYVHPVVVDNDIAASDNFKSTRVKRTAQERHREEAELRNVYAMFVNPKVEVRVTKNEQKDKQMFKVLNDIMNLSSRVLDEYSGHLRQFIVDDKGLVMIITFGLRGTTIPNMIALRALPATIAIYNALQSELGVECRIGATFGEAYCGVVGGVKRHEYAVLGPSVNLAARLMASKTNPGILVDNTVRVMANRSYGFNALPPVIAKGYSEPVPIFEPLSPLERVWGRILPNFVGRKEEIMSIMGMARDMVLSESVSKLVIVESKSGMGKTTMVAHCIEHIRKLMGANKHRLIVTKNVGKESDSLVPFGAFRAILLDVLAWFRASNDDKSFKSGASCYSSLQNSIAWESLSGRSTTHSASVLSASKSADVLRVVCKELDMPPSFIEHALQSLLGSGEVTSRGDEEQQKVKPPSEKMMVSFMARAFRICTQDSKLVVVALDDLHHADLLSWKVIREIYETAQNVLIISTSYPTNTCKLKVDPDFWEALNNIHKANGRFVSMSLGTLSREEVTCMIMKTLGLQKKEVKGDLLDGVTIQSGGMPHFVNEILEHMKRQMAVDVDFEISDMTYESFGDLVLQRLDSFDASTRNMLNIGAVIGLSFSLDEVVAVQMRSSDATQFTVRQLTVKSLESAVTEGILETRTIGRDGDGGRGITKYSFYHAVWRSALLHLMLEGRKRDLHRTIAETLEEQSMGIDDYMFQTKLFNHWINSANFGKAAELALTVGKHFEERLGLPAQSIRLYNDALDLLRESNDMSLGIGGFTTKVLAAVDATDLSFIIRLQVALGQALAMAQQMTESVTAFQDALRIVQAAKSSAQLKNRSILFPVFTGLSLALKRGHIVQDEQCRYEQAMVRRYVQETKLFGDPIHIIHSITLQAEMYSALGDFARAVESHQQLESVYNVEEHSISLYDEYGSDLGAQSFASSSMWNLRLGNTDEALGTGWFVIEELMPKIEKRNVHASFMIMYPILWTMKENGFALEAREYFEEFVCEAYTEYYGEGRSTFFLPLYDPVLMLLDLAGNADVDDMMVEEYLEWALDIDNLGFGTLINSKTGEMGRTADSVAAEICFLLAGHINDEDDRATLIENGIEVATDDLELTKRKKMLLAEYFSSNTLRCLEDLNENIVDDDEFG